MLTPPEPQRTKCRSQLTRGAQQRPTVELVGHDEVLLAARARQQQVDGLLLGGRRVQLDSSQHLLDLAVRTNDGLGVPTSQPVAVALQERRQLLVQLLELGWRLANVLLIATFRLGDSLGLLGIGRGDCRFESFALVQELVELVVQLASTLPHGSGLWCLGHKASPLLRYVGSPECSSNINYTIF